MADTKDQVPPFDEDFKNIAALEPQAFGKAPWYGELVLAVGSLVLDPDQVRTKAGMFASRAVIREK